MFDHINSVFLLEPEDAPVREDIVLFNPRKGFQNTSRLIAGSDARIRWRALWGLSPEEMVRAMEGAKVYVDFGVHPGRDKIPREAALRGLCVVTNRAGAAQNAQDVSIPDAYKFDNGTEPRQILETIYGLLAEFPERQAEFAPYAAKTRREFMRFEVEAAECFGALTGSGLPAYGTPEEALEAAAEAACAEDYGKAFQCLVRRRMDGGEDTAASLLLESGIRMRFGEPEEAYFCAREGLSLPGEEKEKDGLYRRLSELCRRLGRDGEAGKWEARLV